jgi:transcriptional regulator with XRE-family HTH domain
MPHRDPTIRSRELGEGLREAMKQAGLNGKQAAQLLDVTPSYVSMLLAGKRGASELDIAAFLGVCRVRGAERDRLLGLCREQDNPGWLQQHGSRLPKQLVTYVDHENKAVTIGDFQSTLVPGLLQIGEYARAVISRIANVPPDEVDDWVAARLARQSLFSRDRPARFTFYLHESALRLPVGGRAVMAEQLRHLQRMSVRSYLTLRVVPVALGAHAATGGSFIFMEFAGVQTGCLSGERDNQPVPGEAGGDPGLPAHPGGAGGHRAGRGTIEGADCCCGNRALRGWRGS